MTQNYWRWGQRETSRWGYRPTQKFALAIQTCWYLKAQKIALPPMQNIKIVLPPTQNPNASQWNIGCVGSQTKIFALGPKPKSLHWPCRFHVVYPVFVCVGYPTQTLFSVEYGLKDRHGDFGHMCPSIAFALVSLPSFDQSSHGTYQLKAGYLTYRMV